MTDIRHERFDIRNSLPTVILSDQKVREPRKRLIRCESGTDSKVWMGEETEQADERLRLMKCTAPNLWIRGFLMSAHIKSVFNITRISMKATE